MEEIWKDIKGYEGLYQVSTMGRIRSIDRFVNSREGRQKPIKGKLIKIFRNRGGYLQVNLWRNMKYKTYLVHRLVATTYIPNPLNLSQINHIDEDKENNRIENLEWCDAQYNNNYGTKPERISEKRKGMTMPRHAVLVSKRKRSKHIIQMDLDGNEIMGWLSGHDCERETGYDQGLIGSVCNGKYRQAYGYRWKYVG